MLPNFSRIETMANDSDARDLMNENARLKKALESIDRMPFSMVNDSESLRYTLRQIKNISRAALAKIKVS
jgi:hypothetical protein